MPKRSSELREIWSHARIYALGSLINRAAGIVLIPFYTHLLPASEFGLYAIVVVTGDIAAVLISGAFGTAMVRIYLESDQPAHRARVASTAFAGFSALGFGIALLAHPASPYLSTIVLGSSEHKLLFELALYGSILGLLFNLELDYFRANKQPWMFLLLSTAKSLSIFLASIALVVYFKMGVLGIVIATAAAFLIIGVTTLVGLFRQIGFHFEPRHAREMVKFGLPLLPSKLADLSTEFTDKYFINLFVGAGAVGNYALAQRIGSLLQNFIASPFAQIWIVRRLETLGEPGGQDVFARIFTLFLALMTGAALGLSLFAPEIVGVISSPQYSGAIDLVPLVSLAFAMMPMDMNFQLSIIHAKRTHLLMYASFAAAAVNVVLMYLLVRTLSTTGAAAALLLTNAARVMLTGWFSMRYCRTGLRFEWGKTAVLLLGGTACYAVVRVVFGTESHLAAVGAKFSVIAGYVLLAWYICTSASRGVDRAVARGTDTDRNGRSP